jgi:hypothetical protein
MFCPLCGTRSEVSETRLPFRDRRCTNAVCGHEFTTREQVMTHRERARLCARTRLTQMKAPSPSADAHVKVRSAPRRALRTSSDLPQVPSAVQQELPYLEAEVAA